MSDHGHGAGGSSVENPFTPENVLLLGGGIGYFGINWITRGVRKLLGFLLG